ncbi:AI-2E family transporter, partial [candidate division WWE3 bacterium]|nr:AI-2E family transporter [candidate division WWE3 bacterium]
METRSITISAKAVLKVLFILFAIWFLYQIRDIVALLFIAVIIASALTPVVDYFEKFSAPRWLVILAVYIIGASFLGLILWGVFPIVAVQIKEFGQNLPTVFNQSVETLGLTELFSDLDTRSIIPDVLGTFADQLIQTPANIYKFG